MVGYKQATRLQPPARRGLEIVVLDGANGPAAGATLQFFVDQEPYGEVEVGSEVIRLDFPTHDAPSSITVVARFVTEQQVIDLPLGVLFPSRYTIQFSAIVKGFWAPRRVARCANGDEGQPCVECTVNGRTYTICS